MQYWYASAPYGADVDDRWTHRVGTTRVRSLKIRAEDARRARMILVLANGDSYSTIEATVRCYPQLHQPVSAPLVADGLDGLRPGIAGNRRRC